VPGRIIDDTPLVLDEASELVDFMKERRVPLAAQVIKSMTVLVLPLEDPGEDRRCPGYDRRNNGARQNRGHTPRPPEGSGIIQRIHPGDA